MGGIGRSGPYVGLENIESRTGKFLASALTTDGDARRPPPLGAAPLSNTFERDDVLFGKLRPYLAKAWVAEFSGRCSTELLVMEPAEIAPGFLRYVCLWSEFVDTVDASTFGSKMPRADWNFIGNVAVPVPERSRQQAICEYLDRETARLDALVAEHRWLLDLLDEKRGALVTGAVVRGLNPTVSFRDSGVPWIGEIPAHWELWKLGHVASIGKGSIPNRGRREYWEDGDIPWLSSSVVNRDEITGAEQYVTRRAVRECHLLVVKRGAVLVAVTGQGKTRGRAAVLSMDATVSSHIAFISFRGSCLSPWYLKWTLAAAYDYLRSISDDVGATRGALYCEELANLRVPVPPAAEQREIVRSIASRTRAIDELAAEAEHTVALLRERRSALIAAAVTGRINLG